MSKITRDELLTYLRAHKDNARGCISCEDSEAHHGKADEMLLAYINDPEITKAFNNIHRWYA